MKWLEVARSYNGLKEYPGAANNPRIIAWARKLGVKRLGIAYDADSVPWCGVFVAHCMDQAGIAVPPIAVRASQWATWGQSCSASLGAVVVFQRPGGGHVGLLIAQSATSYLVLGGNQGDAVQESWIAKDRAVAIRWPADHLLPLTPLPLRKTSGPLSTNER